MHILYSVTKIIQKGENPLNIVFLLSWLIKTSGRKFVFKNIPRTLIVYIVLDVGKLLILSST